MASSAAFSASTLLCSLAEPCSSTTACPPFESSGQVAIEAAEIDEPEETRDACLGEVMRLLAGLSGGVVERDCDEGQLGEVS